MIDWREAQARVLALGTLLPVEAVPLVEAAGRWLAEDVVARRTQPARDLSAMDGYAVRHADLPGPWTVVGTSAAGAPFAGTIAAGQAVRIFTGAALPEGSDTVIVQEDVGRSGDTIAFTSDTATSVGTFVRRAGSDFDAGARLLNRGDLLTPARIALAAMAGHGTLPVRRRPRVALLSTGDELVPAGTDPGRGRLPDSNAPMLAALLTALPVTCVDLGIVRDDAAALEQAFASAMDCDVIVTSGGASVGDHDLVRPALEAAGATLDFWKVAMRPGKPLMAGRLGDAVVLGLPGNPVSAFVTATLFLRPLLRAIGGAPDPIGVTASAVLDAPLPAVGPRTDFVRAKVCDGHVTPLPSTDSGVLSALADADALIVRERGAPAQPAGAEVNILALA